MGHHAKIIAYIRDAFDDRWDVREFRDTEHDFAIAFGWPSGFPRGRGGVGGPRTILTEPLVKHLEGVRYELTPIPAANLPLGRQQIKRVRKMLGHDRKADRRAWWVANLESLQPSDTLKDLAVSHGISPSAAELMWLSLHGQTRGHKPAWFREPAITEKIISGLPVSFIAQDLDRTCDDICRARYVLTKERGA